VTDLGNTAILKLIGKNKVNFQDGS